MSGKVIIITGASYGSIGFEVAKRFAKMNAIVILASRKSLKGQAMVKHIRDFSENEEVYSFHCDFSQLHSVKIFSEKVKTTFGKIDFLIHCAGEFGREYALTKDGFERTFQINALGPFYLTKLMIYNMKSNGRFVFLVDDAHRDGKIDYEQMIGSNETYNKMASYSNSKLMILMLAYELQRVINEKEDNLRSIVINPGVVSTNLWKNVPLWLRLIWYPMRMCMRSPKDAVNDVVFGVISFKAEGGSYYQNFQENESSFISYDQNKSRELWVECENRIKEI
jgi:NAD(P)-dependent dehydrogenase (short-subunit alcohol dehydrogenase family)